LDDRCSRFWSKAIKLEKGRELIDSLSQIILDAFKIYYTSNKTLPEEIVVYRDGISEGELDAALAKEAQAIAIAARRVPPSIYKNYSPPSCYILCNKRVNNKFFYRNRGRTENVPIGTLIDAEITRANVHEFYLMSTQANNGTSNPVRYQVVHNRTGLSPVDIEKLTFKLTHMYYNWSGTIKVPSPVFYAHKQAYFSSKVIGQKNVHDRLATSFYYL
jgi:aubergine-like protein